MTKKLKAKHAESKVSPPKRRSRELSTQKLLQAGLEVFSKYGFEGATTKQIAKRSGMNEALIARYFESKQGLLNAIIIQFAENVRQKSSEYSEGKTLEEEITNYIEAHIEIVMEQRDFTRIVISKALTDTKLSRDLQKYFFVDADELLVRRLKEFQKKGLIAPDRDVLMAANMIQLEAVGVCLMNSIFDGYCDRFDEKSCWQLAYNLAYGLQTPLKKK